MSEIGARTRTALLLAAITALAYLPSLGGAFQFDDYNVIVNYPTVHSWSTLFERAGGGVRAVLKASYVLNWTLDPGPLGFHLVNIALHALNAVLLFSSDGASSARSPRSSPPSSSPSTPCRPRR